MDYESAALTAELRARICFYRPKGIIRLLSGFAILFRLQDT
jgi:hypothetical protein